MVDVMDSCRSHTDASSIHTDVLDATEHKSKIVRTCQSMLRTQNSLDM